MLRHRAGVIWALTAAVLPAAPACAAEATPAPPASLPLAFQPRLPAAAPDLRADGARAATAPEAEHVFAFSRAGDLPPGLAGGAGASSFSIAPALSSSRTGWHFSGRLGPVRWLSPLDGEGETKMRFGGRLPGQPRLPGSGVINFGVHYAFE